MSQIIIENITKTYTVANETINAVLDTSLEVGAGEFVSIVGHSGSGKTTLLSILGGIARPTSGRVLFDGTDIYSLDTDGLSEYRSGRVGFMFQFASLLPVLTARENLLLPLVFHKGASGRKPEDNGKAAELLKMVGLGDKINAYPGHLSGGQQRRVAIARAFMNDPELILADEPTGDLDVETETDMLEFFRKMNREKNITFVMVTHNISIAESASQRFRMSNGQIEKLVGK
jgi:putative ABC transport system ATP-binding protein/lipoprotein-releasing system ATP-binding protein